MKKDIYYFSGTGNSLSIAQKISDALDDTELLSIPKMINDNKSISGDIIGIVCPIYMYRLPYIVVDFIKRIEKADYIFIVFTGAGELGNGIKFTEDLFNKNNLTLSSLFNIKMPSNYTPYGCPTEEDQKEMIENAEIKVDQIVKLVNEKAIHRDDKNTTFFKSNVHPGILYKLGYDRIRIMDNSFYIDENCNECAICEQVCPVKNITLEDKKPRWHNKCEQCYGCLQWCPKESIQYGKNTIGVQRYHNPKIKVKDIINSHNK